MGKSTENGLASNLIKRLIKRMMLVPLILAAIPVIITVVPAASAQPVWYNCLTRERFSPEKQVWCQRWQTLQNAAYRVPTTLDSNPSYQSVMLEAGQYQQADGKFIVELVNQSGWMTFGDLNQDGKTDAAVIFGVALDPDGKAVGTYLTAVLDIDGDAQALTPIRLGERIMLNGPIAIENSRIVIPFLTATEVINRAYAIDQTLRESSLPPVKPAP